MDFNNTFNNNNQFMNFNFGYNNINNNNPFCINNSNNINCMNNMNLMNNNMNNMNLMNNSKNNGNNMNFMNNMNCLNCMNNLNNRNNTNKVNNINQTSYNHINVTFISPSGLRVVIVSSLDEKINDLIDKYLKKVGLPKEIFIKKLVFLLGTEKLDYNNLTLAEIGIEAAGKPTITVVDESDIIGQETPPYKKVINIKFLKLPNISIYKNNNKEIIGILKLCLLKEVSQKLSDDKLNQLPDIFNYIMKLL